MPNIIGDEFGYGFMLYNCWLVFSLYLLIIQVLPIWRGLKKILIFPVVLRVKIGSKMRLQFAHIALFMNAVFMIMIYLSLQSYQKPDVEESPVNKNIRLSKKWQYETYIWQSTIAFCCWLYTMAFGSLNDRKSLLEDEILELKKSQNKKTRKEEDKKADEVVETRRPKDDISKKND
ncbi:unnamed protein product [Moneuplotes crassus]|uniref:BAP29/BAP31 transmembrane domain-containing protein n=1 Tax=Euplotes crassus TaxID=5936 RepID=A0AAD2D5U0_EUPCR|nr:unnamed protein product [Moneuplotes crassus]